jgi:hypothetical protein
MLYKFLEDAKLKNGYEKPTHIAVIFDSATLILGVFFGISIQIMMLGIIGEYVGFILTQVRKMPLVIERERINF